MTLLAARIVIEWWRRTVSQCRSELSCTYCQVVRSGYRAELHSRVDKVVQRPPRKRDAKCI
jgi:hypothetical protein